MQQLPLHHLHAAFRIRTFPNFGCLLAHTVDSTIGCMVQRIHAGGGGGNGPCRAVPCSVGNGGQGGALKYCAEPLHITGCTLNKLFVSTLQAERLDFCLQSTMALLHRSLLVSRSAQNEAVRCARMDKAQNNPQILHGTKIVRHTPAVTAWCNLIVDL